MAAEAPVPGRVLQFFPGMFRNIAQFSMGFHEKVTRIDITVVFNHKILAAVSGLMTYRVLSLGHEIDDGVEIPDRYFSGVLLDPSVKDLAKKIAPFFPGNGIWSFMPFGAELHTRNILVMMDSHPAEISVNFFDPMDIG